MVGLDHHHHQGSNASRVVEVLEGKVLVRDHGEPHNNQMELLNAADKEVAMEKMKEDVEMSLNVREGVGAVKSASDDKNKEWDLK